MSLHRLFEAKDAVIQKFKSFPELGVEIHVKREDLLHAEVSGNKLRKLKYNLLEAERQQHDTILTYGGAFSNHIAATAAAANKMGFKSIGVIRGEELGRDLEKTLASNATLRGAQRAGMELFFVDRTTYREKQGQQLQKELYTRYGRLYNIPDGGTNELAIKGTEEILTPSDLTNYDIICVAAGTGGTAAGIINTAATDQSIYVFSALKGDFIRDEIRKYVTREDFVVINDRRFGGYAKSDDILIDYMNVRFRESGIPLEPIYTAKMMYGIEQMLEAGVIQGKTRILAIHTGGLQGIPGYNQMLAKKRRPKIEYEHEL